MKAIFTTIKKNITFDILTILAVSLGLFYFILYHGVSTDIPVHSSQVININLGKGSYPPNFLYYYIINLLTLFSTDQFTVKICSLLILSLAVVLKYAITKKIIASALKIANVKAGNMFIIFVSVCLFFFFAIPDFYNIMVSKKMYLGKFAPTVWHNSTTIFLFPFALLLFWTQYKLINSKESIRFKDWGIITLLIILNAVIKPSFLFVFLPATGMFLLSKYGLFRFKQLFINLLPLIIGVCAILIIYILIYKFQQGSFHSSKSAVALSKPFEVMLKFIPNWYIPYAVVYSFALPIIFLFFYPEYLKDKLVLYTLILTIGGILIGAFIYEEGPRKFHGNFLWQNIICSYLLMLVILIKFAAGYLQGYIKGRKKIFLMIISSLHILSGIAYILKIIILKKYS